MIFRPRNYDSPVFKNRAGTQYWDLPTGSRIGYTLISAKGKKKPYPVIYLHGGPGGYVSGKVIEILSSLSFDGYDVYFYDQVGGGRSGRLENIKEYTVDRHIKDLDEIIKKTGAQKIILIGQSWGAILSVLFLADHPGKVEKIIFTSPGPVFPTHNELAKIKAPDSLHFKEPFYSNRQGNEKANN